MWNFGTFFLFKNNTKNIILVESLAHRLTQSAWGLCGFVCGTLWVAVASAHSTYTLEVVMFGKEARKWIRGFPGVELPQGVWCGVSGRALPLPKPTTW